MASNKDAAEGIRTILQSAAEALCRMDTACVEKAESLIAEALKIARSPSDRETWSAETWPAAELALCRQMAETTSQFWERRRAARMVINDGPAPLFLMG